MSTSRVAALSDGIIAIAATLLVLEIHAPDPASEHLWRALWDEWPAYLSYAISFLTIGIVWVNHHVQYDSLIRVDRTILFLNLLLMMVVGFIPFPTGFLADAFRTGEGQSVAAIVYGMTMLAMASVFTLTWRYLRQTPGLVADPGVVPQRLSRSYIGPIVYGVATLIAIVAPIVALFLFGAIALYFVHPGRGARTTLTASE